MPGGGIDKQPLHSFRGVSHSRNARVMALTCLPVGILTDKFIEKFQAQIARERGFGDTKWLRRPS